MCRDSKRKPGDEAGGATKKQKTDPGVQKTVDPEAAAKAAARAARFAPSAPAPEAPKKDMAWSGGEIKSNKEEAIKKYMERPGGDSLGEKTKTDKPAELGAALGGLTSKNKAAAVKVKGKVKVN